MCVGLVGGGARGGGGGGGVVFTLKLLTVCDWCSFVLFLSLFTYLIRVNFSLRVYDCGILMFSIGFLLVCDYHYTRQRYLGPPSLLLILNFVCGE